jgi:hypothetical protein
MAGSGSVKTPSVPDSTMKSAGPLSSRFAATTNSSESAARGTSAFSPSRTKPPSCTRALVFSSNGSNSARGSITAKAAAGTSSPRKAGR